MKIKDLFEAKFRKPILMYHGTSTAFLRSILKHGLLPNPKQKIWKDDPDASIYTQSRASLLGAYFSSHFMVAYSSSGNSVRKYPGNRLMILAKIQTQSAKADEDSISGYLNISYNQAFGGNYSDNYRVVSEIYYDYPEQYETIKTKFIEILHKKLSVNKNKPVPPQLLSDTFDSISLRIIAYGNKEDKWLFSRINNKPTNIPSTIEAEERLLQIKDKLTSYYRESAIDSNRFAHTLRITEPVGFSGANRITHIIELPYRPKTDNLEDKKAILHYGNINEIPNTFFNDYSNFIGKFPDFK